MINHTLGQIFPFPIKFDAENKIPRNFELIIALFINILSSD